MKEGLDEFYFYHQRHRGIAIKTGTRRSESYVWTSISPLNWFCDILQSEELLEA